MYSYVSYFMLVFSFNRQLCVIYYYIYHLFHFRCSFYFKVKRLQISVAMIRFVKIWTSNHHCGRWIPQEKSYCKTSNHKIAQWIWTQPTRIYWFRKTSLHCFDWFCSVIRCYINFLYYSYESNDLVFVSEPKIPNQ